MTPNAALRSCIGSLLPVGFSSIAQKPTSVSILSASATAIDTGSVGTQIVGPLRPVVILDGVRDGFVLALRLGVVFPHQCLAAREIRRPFGEQIGLAQKRRAFGLFHIGADERREFRRQPLDALDALGHCVPSFS